MDYYGPDQKEQYAAWLSDLLKELCISQRELGEAIGVSQKTISRYVLDENAHLPPESTRAAIAAYLKEKATIGAFEHIPSDDFGQMLYILLEEYEISQNQLAKETGIHQKDISKYVNNKAKSDTSTQYKLLDYFLSRSYAGKVYSSLHFDTAVNLDYILNGDLHNPDLTICLTNDGCEGKIGFPGNYRSCIEYILTLPTVLQNLIWDHFYAFYDDAFYTEAVCGGRKLSDFRTYKYTIDLFRQLSDERREMIAKKLQEHSVIGYPQDFTEEDIFSRVRDYYCVISANVPQMKQNKNCLRDKESKADFTRKFEEFLNYFLIDDDKLINQIQYKLTLTRYEWYIWMLLVIYDCKGYSLPELANEMIHIIHVLDF